MTLFVPREGCRWEAVSDDLWLVPNVLGQSESPAPLLYDPMLKPEVVTEFADLDGGADGVVAFANRWGFLGVADSLPGSEPADMRNGEALTDWQQAITDVRLGLAIWEAMNRLSESDRRRRLRTLIVLSPASDGGDDFAYYRLYENGWLHRRIDSPKRFDNDVQRSRRGSYVEAARLGLDGLLNFGIADTTTLELDVLPGDQGARFRYRPSTLRGAIWLHIAQLVAGRALPKVCRNCGKMFVTASYLDAPEPDGRRGRSDRQYCEERCRWRDANGRRSAAKRQRAGVGRPASDGDSAKLRRALTRSRSWDVRTWTLSGGKRLPEGFMIRWGEGDDEKLVGPFA